MEKEKLAPLYRRESSNWMVGCIVVLMFFGLCFFAAKTEAQVFRIEPSVLVSEEYNDNVHLQQRNDKAEALITRFAPSIRVNYTTSFWEWNLNYTYNFYYYYFSSRHNNAGLEEANHDQTHVLSARNRTEIIKDSLFFELSDEYSRVSNNIAVNYTQQSPSANQVDRNIFTVNPYLILRPASNSRIIFGYIFQDTHYLNAVGINQASNVNHVDNVGYGDVIINLSSRLTFTLGTRYTHDRNDLLSYNEIDVYAGPQYAYAENCFLYARAGKSWFDFGASSNASQRFPNQEYWFWNGGITHRISTITIEVNASRSAAQDPQRAVTLADQYTATIRKTAPRYELTVGGGWYEYKDGVIDQRLYTSAQVQGTLLYRVMPTTTATLGIGFQNVNDLVLGGERKIIFGDIRLEHHLSRRDVMSLGYRFVNSHSAELPSYNYFNNRYFIEYGHTF